LDGIPNRECASDKFAWPSSIAIAPDGSVYVADTYNHRIKKFDSNGNFIAEWGSFCVIDGYSYYDIYGNDSLVLNYPCGDGDFAWPVGLSIGIDGTLYVVDSENNRIQRLILAPSGKEKIFETAITTTQSSSTSQVYTTNIGTLNTTGKFFLNAELKNSLGQILGKAEYPFYIIEGDILILFNTNKRVYKPNETILITGEVKNLASIMASNLNLQILANGHNIYDVNFDLPAGSSYPFSVITSASTEGSFILSGKVMQNNSLLVEMADLYEVTVPEITTVVLLPEVVGTMSLK